jgi:hypothetical protein
VERNLVGELARFNAALALESPFFAAASSRDFLDETSAISDMENKPLTSTKSKIIRSSKNCSFVTKTNLSIIISA